MGSLQFMVLSPLKISSSHSKYLTTVILIIGLAGCATPEPLPEPVVEASPVVNSQEDNLRLEIARLEKIIAEKDELIKSQQIRQQNQARALKEVNKEATRAQVKLHRLATKPSTASAIAETEVALDQLRQTKIPATEQILLVQAQHLTERASALYTEDQFASAMNYVAQAKYLIGLITDPNRKKASNENSMLLEFQTPIKLHTRANANLRKAPNAQSQIIATLKKDTVVTASASQGSWFRVQLEKNSGWILNTGLEVIKKPLP